MIKLLSGLSLLLVVIVGTGWAVGWIEVRVLGPAPSAAPDPDAEAATNATPIAADPDASNRREAAEDPSIVEGEILSIDPAGSFLVLAIRRGPEEQRFELRDDVTVRIDGQACTVKDLATSDIARLHLSEASDPSRVVRIEVERP